MKLSLLTAFSVAWLYGMVAGLVLPHGPLALVLYSLILLGVTSVAHVGQQAILHQLALAEFRQEMHTARQMARQALYGGN